MLRFSSIAAKRLPTDRSPQFLRPRRLPALLPAFLVLVLDGLVCAVSCWSFSFPFNSGSRGLSSPVTACVCVCVYDESGNCGSACRSDRRRWKMSSGVWIIPACAVTRLAKLKLNCSRLEHKSIVMFLVRLAQHVPDINRRSSLGPGRLYPPRLESKNEPASRPPGLYS
jgi:hypothetical protein